MRNYCDCGVRAPLASLSDLDPEEIDPEMCVVTRRKTDPHVLKRITSGAGSPDSPFRLLSHQLGRTMWICDAPYPTPFRTNESARGPIDDLHRVRVPIAPHPQRRHRYA